MTKEIERAEHHLDECNDMECKFNITGICYYGLRDRIGCYKEDDFARQTTDSCNGLGGLELTRAQKLLNELLSNRPKYTNPMEEKFCKYCDFYDITPQQIIDPNDLCMLRPEQYEDKPYCKKLELHLEYIEKMYDDNGNVICVQYKRNGMD